MTIGLVYWVLMLLWLVGAFWWNWPGAPGHPYFPLGNALLIFLLFLLLGWKVFGAPVHG